MVVTTKFGFGSRLCKGNVLTTFTFVVLNWNHLIRFVNRIIVYVICFLLITKCLKGKEKVPNKFFITVLDKIAGLASTNPQVR